MLQYNTQFLKYKRNCSMTRLNSTSKFIQQLRSILNVLKPLSKNQKYNGIVHWKQNEKLLRIIDSNAFEQQILPLYFRHAKFKSFVRQLNMYRFRKVRNCAGILAFKNALFNGTEDSQNTIERKLSNKIQMSEEIENPSFEKISNPEDSIEKEYQNTFMEEQIRSPLRLCKLKSNCRIQHNFLSIPPIALYSFASDSNHCFEGDDNLSVSMEEDKVKKTRQNITETEQNATLM